MDECEAHGCMGAVLGTQLCPAVLRGLGWGPVCLGRGCCFLVLVLCSACGAVLVVLMEGGCSLV